jgi:hypothetical protein
MLLDSLHFTASHCWHTRCYSATAPSLDHENSSRWGVYLQAKHPITSPESMSRAGSFPILRPVSDVLPGHSILPETPWLLDDSENSRGPNVRATLQDLGLKQNRNWIYQPQLTCRTSTPGQDSKGLGQRFARHKTDAAKPAPLTHTHMSCKCKPWPTMSIHAEVISRLDECVGRRVCGRWHMLHACLCMYMLLHGQPFAAP